MRASPVDDPGGADTRRVSWLTSTNGAVEGMNNKAHVLSHHWHRFTTAPTYITALYHCLNNLPEPDPVRRFL